MEDRRYDILRKENEKSLIWLEDAMDLAGAESRVKELISFWPGEYQIFDIRTKQMVLNLASSVAAPSRE
jgi:hypothetical protein